MYCQQHCEELRRFSMPADASFTLYFRSLSHGWLWLSTCLLAHALSYQACAGQGQGSISASQLSNTAYTVCTTCSNVCKAARTFERLRFIIIMMRRRKSFRFRKKPIMLAGIEGFETFLFSTGVLYNLLVVYAFVQALVLILMLCSFIQRWYIPATSPNQTFAGPVEQSWHSCTHAL